MTDTPQFTADPATLTAPTCICGSLRKTTRVVTQFYDEALKPVRLKPGQFTVLATLALHGPQRVVDIARRLEIERTTMIRNVRLLEKNGLVGSEKDPDRKASVLSLTEAGADTLKQAVPLWQKAQSQIRDYLGEDRWTGLLTDLSITIDAVRQK